MPRPNAGAPVTTKKVVLQVSGPKSEQFDAELRKVVERYTK